MLLIVSDGLPLYKRLYEKAGPAPIFNRHRKLYLLAVLKHIIEEFTRVALAFPEVYFSLSNNGQELFHWEAGSFKQRAINVFGSSYQSKLVAIGENTDYLTITGYVGKPDTAKKTRSDQYFFVNRRFIKSAY